jgi:hypothetical protein
MIARIALLILSLASTHSTWASNDYPLTPQPSLTPGSLCQNGGSRRYPERIPYCERDVDHELKEQVVRNYDRTFGYRVGSIGRHHFKIDHYIPLCMGGSNNADNLWPQHPSVYEITDPIEPLLCERMAKGLISQAEAIKIIKIVKNDLNRAPQIIRSMIILE